VTVEIDFGDVLGAAEAGSAERLTLYIPSRDRNGVAFDPEP